MKTLFFFTFFIFLSFLPKVEAATISVVWPKETIAPESMVTVSVFLETDKSINALLGDLSVQGATLKGVEEAGSALLFWVEKPTVKENILHFSGITPGGIPIGKHLLFKVTVETLGEGEVRFLGNNLQALLNDGLGTEEALSVKKNTVSVKRGAAQISFIQKEDSIPPEAFSILQGRSDDIAEGKWFISFATVDKQTGIAGYEVEESVVPPYFWFLFSREKKLVESPYVVTGQGTTYVLVRAIDLSGNSTESFLSPQLPLFWYLVILVLVMMGVLLYRVRRRKR